MSGFNVSQPGILSLLQDAGRFGHHRIGLTNGGPLDKEAFAWANRLVDNPLDATAIEVTVGGLVLEAEVDTYLVVTGANVPLKINAIEQDLWHAHAIKAGDRIELGFATEGARAYLAVSGGFNITPSFSSSATVTREGIGGLNGAKLQQGDYLPCAQVSERKGYLLAPEQRPRYTDAVSLRVVSGYQQDSFSAVAKRLFFSSEYQVTDRADRMGYRLAGPEIQSSLDGILSEGICQGAIQIPADGQPIVLLNDRQTIGGYPKIGSVIAQDTGRLAQLLPGSSLRFSETSIDDAHNLYCLAQHKFANTLPIPVR